MGKSEVLYWNSRHYSVDNNVGYDRAPRNPFTGRQGTVSEIAIAIEVFLIAYVVITAIIIKKEEIQNTNNQTEKA